MKTLITILLLPLALMAGNAIHIGSSLNSKATAGNNARMIARTLDDRRVVVYQDSTNGHETIKLLFSDDGTNWTAPLLFAYGFAPSIAVTTTDTFYVTWLTRDSDWPRGVKFHSRDIPAIPQNSPPHARGEQQNINPVSCCIDVDDQFIHQVYHFIDMNDSKSKIQYSLLTKDWRVLTRGIAAPSLVSDQGESPTVSCDLEYQPGPAHIAWTEKSNGSRRIKYLAVDARKLLQEFGGNVEDYLQAGFCFTLTDADGFDHASLSVRNEMNDNGDKVFSMLIGGFDDSIANGLAIQTWEFDSRGPTCTPSFSYKIKDLGPCLPSMDDVIVPMRSCAVVWQRDNDIHYGQTRGAEITTNPPQRLNKESAAPARHPNVCYKTFRPDVFDVIWTEGNAPPFEILYRRVAKDYSAIHLDAVTIKTTTLPPANMAKAYKAFIELECDDAHNSATLVLVNGELPNGLSLQWDSPDRYKIVGVPQEAGDFPLTLRAWPPHATPRRDYLHFTDVAELLLKVELPMGADNLHNIAPYAYTLFPVYPNPFNSSTKIEFTIPVPSQIRIAIYNPTGELVAILAEGQFQAGAHQIEWDALRAPSGVYFIHMHMAHVTAVQKCVLLK